MVKKAVRGVNWRVKRPAGGCESPPGGFGGQPEGLGGQPGGPQGKVGRGQKKKKQRNRETKTQISVWYHRSSTTAQKGGLTVCPNVYLIDRQALLYTDSKCSGSLGVKLLITI